MTKNDEKWRKMTKKYRKMTKKYRKMTKKVPKNVTFSVTFLAPYLLILDVNSRWVVLKSGHKSVKFGLKSGKNRSKMTKIWLKYDSKSDKNLCHFLALFCNINLTNLSGDYV